MDRLSEYVIKHSSCSMPRCEYVENGIEIDCDKCQKLMIKEHDRKIRAETLIELWKRAIYMHDEYIEYEELDNIIDEMLKEQK